MVESVLDDVPGLGEVRRKTLLKHFGSLKKLRAATRRRDRAGAGHRRRAPPTRDQGRRSRRAPPAADGTCHRVNTATGEIEE